MGYSPEWIAIAKRSIASITPRFNVARMVGEYAQKFYAPAARQGRRYAADDFAPAREVAAWKARIRAAWPAVRLRRLDEPTRRMTFGNSVRIEIAVQLHGLAPSDITVEALFGRPDSEHYHARARHYALSSIGSNDKGEQIFALDLTPEQCGKLEYRIRAYPAHPLLTHKFELGLMAWL
jgi:starch phosphorylase